MDRWIISCKKADHYKINPESDVYLAERSL